EEIQRIVCEYLHLPEDLVRAKTRKREIVQARQVAMYFCKVFTQHSLKTIGLHFGGRDHSTVIHAIQSVENQIETDSKFRDMIEEIRQKIELRSRYKSAGGTGSNPLMGRRSEERRVGKVRWN